MNTVSRGFNEVGHESKRHADLEGEINDGKPRSKPSSFKYIRDVS